jgi:2-phosphosulfolactate phosphatase
MEFKRLTLRDCAQATGTVVVIDVLRAFTTAAYAFAAGAREIVLTDSVEEAFALRDRFANDAGTAAGDDAVLLMGEVGGEPIDGFDLGNSPAALAAPTLAASGLDLAGRRLVQRTSAGTRGVVCASRGADVLLAGSLVVGGATARYLRQLQPEQVTFVITGAHDRGPSDGEEDVAGADYIQALLARSETGQSIGKTGQSKPTAVAGLQTAPLLARSETGQSTGETGQSTKPIAVAGLQTAPCERPDVDPAPYVQRVRGSFVGRLFGTPEYSHLSAADIELAVDVDRFDFCLRVQRENGLLVMRPVRV